MLYESQKVVLPPLKNIEDLHAVESLTARIGRLRMTADTEMLRAGLAASIPPMNISGSQF